MSVDVVETGQRRELRPLLAPRRAVEAMHRKGRRAHGRGDFILRHDRLVAPVLKAALRLAGVYSRGVRNARNPLVRQWRFESGNLPAGFDGFRILQLADLHVDCMDDFASVVAERVAGILVDVCVMTGDYGFRVDGPVDAVFDGMRTILPRVRSDNGVIAVLGNHDSAEIALGLEDMGVQVLVNEAVEVARGEAGIWIAGVDDPHYYGCDDLPAALRGVPAGAFKVLLAHTPEMFAEAADAGIDLYLCGHTHAGQIRFPRIGAPLKNARCPSAYARGRWRHGTLQGYTSAGAGCSMLPVRFNCPPEITVIELAAKLSGR